MTSAASRPPIPWGYVTGLAVSQLTAYGAFYCTFPALLVPMEREFGWSRPQVGLAFTIGLCVQAACSYGIGRWIDRHGGRTMMPVGMLAGATLLVLWLRVDALWQLYVVWGLLGIVVALLGLSGSPWPSMGSALLFGAGMGIKTIVQATASAELLGRAGYGATQGLLTIPALLAQAATPFASAVIWSRCGGYDGLLLAALASVALSLAGFAVAAVAGSRR